MVEFITRELQYAPAVFASSAYWAVVFIAASALYRLYSQVKSPEALPH